MVRLRSVAIRSEIFETASRLYMAANSVTTFGLVADTGRLRTLVPSSSKTSLATLPSRPLRFPDIRIMVSPSTGLVRPPTLEGIRSPPPAATPFLHPLFPRPPSPSPSPHLHP